MIVTNDKFVNFIAISLFISIPVLHLTGCSGKRINQLQGSVDTLEDQLQRYQQTALQETEFTTTSLTELQKEISQAFRDIRYSQSNIESLVDQISTRLSAVERQTAQMQSKLDQLDTQALDNFNTLNTSIQQSREEAHTNLNQHIENMRDIIASIRSEAASLKQQDQSLQSKVEAMDKEHRQLMEQFSKASGVNIPQPAQSSRQSTASGNTYTVKPGDMLSKIASTLNVDMAELQRLNNISDPSKIIVGQVLQLP
jgi:LysM repeat protein